MCVVLLFPPLSSFFCNATATTEIYTLSLHDALPISLIVAWAADNLAFHGSDVLRDVAARATAASRNTRASWRSEEHTSELQSLRHLVCRLLLEKKKKKQAPNTNP